MCALTTCTNLKMGSAVQVEGKHTDAATVWQKAACRLQDLAYLNVPGSMR